MLATTFIFTSMKNASIIFKKNYVVCIIATLCCLLWGSAFPVIKIGYKILEISNNDTATIILFAGLRFILAGLLTIIIFSLFEKKLLLPKKHSIHKICVLSLFQTIIQYLFFYLGLAHTTGVRASIVNGLNVVIVLFISVFLFRQENFNLKKTVACLFGFLGVAVAGGLFIGELNGGFNIGDLFLIFSGLGYSFSSVFMKVFSKDDNPALLSGYQFVLGGLVLAITGYLMGGNINFNLSGSIVIIYLAFVSAIAYSCWSILIKYNDVSKVTVYSSLTQIFGFVLSYAMLGEDNGNLLNNVFGLILVVIGMFVLNSKGKDKSKINI